jgi:hypothetical protein
MFLNNRSPLRLTVKTNKAKLYYLNKNDALDISKSYTSIWREINKRSLFNWEQINRLKNKILKIFKINNNEKAYPLYFSNSIVDNTNLQSIPTLSEFNLDYNLNILNDNILKKNRSLNTIKESKSIEENTITIINKSLNIPDLNNFLESNDLERTERIDLEKNYEEENKKNDSTSKYDDLE